MSLRASLPYLPHIATRSLVLTFLLFLALPLTDANAQSPLVLLNSWGTPGTAEGQLDAPLRMDVPDPEEWVLAGSLFVVDGPDGAHRVQRFDVDGTFVRGYATSLIDPVSVTVIEGDVMGLPAGNIAVLDVGASEVRILDAETGALIDQWPVPASSDGDLDYDPWTGSLWVCFTDLHIVQEYSLSGVSLRMVGTSGVPGSGVGSFDSPRSLEARDDYVCVADTANDRVIMMWWYGDGSRNWTEGGGSGTAPGEFDQPWAITMDCQGMVWVADRGNRRIQRLRIVPRGWGSIPYELVFDGQWFESASPFTDLIDLVNPARPVFGVTGRVPSARELPRRDVVGPGVPGIFALDRSTAVLRHFEDECCYPGSPLLVTVTTAGGSLLISPAGTGPTLGEVGATVEVEIRDGCGLPIAGFPYQDLFLDDAGTGDIGLCLWGRVADANTDAMGRTTLSGAIAGGGWTQSGMQLGVAGILVGPVLPIDVVSPDINGDLFVNLGDIAAFAVDFSGDVSTFRSDLDHDGQLSLGDLGILAVHYGESCP